MPLNNPLGYSQDLADWNLLNLQQPAPSASLLSVPRLDGAGIFRTSDPVISLPANNSLLGYGQDLADWNLLNQQQQPASPELSPSMPGAPASRGLLGAGGLLDNDLLAFASGIGGQGFTKVPTTFLGDVGRGMANVKTAQAERRARAIEELKTRSLLAEMSEKQLARAAAAKFRAGQGSMLPEGHPLKSLADQGVLTREQVITALTPDLKTLAPGAIAFNRKGEAVVENPKPRTFTNENALRKEFTQLTGPFRIIQRNWAGLHAAEDSPQGDLAMVFAFMKILDPGSAVKEGEYATAENTKGIPAAIGNMYNRIKTGSRLTADQRVLFTAQADALMHKSYERYLAQEEEYRGIAQSQGANVESVVPKGLVDRALREKDWGNTAERRPIAAKIKSDYTLVNENEFRRLRALTMAAEDEKSLADLFGGWNEPQLIALWKHHSSSMPKWQQEVWRNHPTVKAARARARLKQGALR